VVAHSEAVARRWLPAGNPLDDEQFIRGEYVIDQVVAAKLPAGHDIFAGQALESCNIHGPTQCLASLARSIPTRSIQALVEISCNDKWYRWKLRPDSHPLLFLMNELLHEPGPTRLSGSKITSRLEQSS